MDAQELVTEFQNFREFAVVPSDVTDQVFNLMINAWKDVVTECALPAVKDLLGDQWIEEGATALKKKFLMRILQNGKMMIVLDKLEASLAPIMSVPSKTVNEEDQQNQAVFSENKYHEADLLKEIRSLHSEINSLKCQKKLLSERMDGVRNLEQVITESEALRNEFMEMLKP